MSFVDAVRSVFSQYAGFSGRARRSEYWYFMLFEFLVNGVLTTLAQVTDMQIFSGLSGIFSLAVLIPAIAVAVRRLHDIGKSGWWLLLSFVPVIGTIALLIMNVKDSQPGTNQFGPNPKGVQ